MLVGLLACASRARLAATFTWCGLFLALPSAVPVHPLCYATLVIATVAWQFTRRLNSPLAHVITVVLALGTLAAAGIALSGGRGDRVHLPRNRPVFIVGDSLSAGLGASKTGTWPEMVARSVNLNVSNLATAGATLGDGASQARSINEPAIVVVELGGNDLLADPSPERFARDLRSLLATLTAAGHRVVMFELPLLPFQNGYGRIQRAVCAEYRVDLLPRRFLAGAISLPGNTTDGLHLSSKGHAWLARRVADAWQ
jgi:acyl-CoA thioesterase-1